MMNFNHASLVKSLQWRYATKKFDPQRKIADVDWAALKSSLQLAPSSFGLQPWKFALISNQELKEQLVPISWGQTQSRDCSHYVVCLARRTIDEAYVDQYIQQIAKVRGTPIDKLNGFRSVILNFAAAMSPDQVDAWLTRQVYIALGQLMTSAAVLGIDACPMEGIDAKKYDELLGVDPAYKSVVACALGYRDTSDPAASQKKVRFDQSDIFREYV
jgi:nitroreductase